jgi:hypothetical protein
MPGRTNIDPLDQLMDFACDLPFIYETADMLLAVPDPSVCDRVAVVEALIRVMSNIYTWQAELRQSSGTSIYRMIPSKLVNPVDDGFAVKLFPFAIYFRSLQVASYFAVSWAILLQAHASLLRLSDHFGQGYQTQASITDLLLRCGSPGEETARRLGADISMLPSGSIKEEGDKLARYLCQSIEYCHMMEMGTFGPQTMCYSRWIMRSYYQQVGAERELQWCRNVENMHGTATRCGIKMMVFQA